MSILCSPLRVCALTTLTSLCIAACGGASEPAPEVPSPGERDAMSAGTLDAATPTPALPGAARDASAPARDAAGTTTTTTTTPTTPRTRICGTAQTWPSPLPAASQRTAARVVPTRFGFIEGPVWLAERGVLLFSDMDFQGGDALGPPASIRQLTPPAALGAFVASSGSNGLALLPDGTLIAATHDTRSLSLLDPRSGARTDLTVRFGGKRFSSPNDLTVRGDGVVYFTDPAWQLGARPRELEQTGVYRVGPALTPNTTLEAEALDLTLDRPNGVALSPDEHTLYVGSAGDEVWRYDVATDGSVSGRKLFARVGGSDGMTVDCAGNVYVASQTVEVFAPSGERLGEIRSDEGPTNVAFGGADRKTLYITAETGLYAIALGVPGFPY